MNLKLPSIIEKYEKASNENNLQDFISCFSESATVLDEGDTVQGHEAIIKWFIKVRSKFQFKTVPLSCDDRGEIVTMTAQVSGNFPGSPVNLDYHFKIESGLISDLKIM